jgi:hypothetical protein
LIVRPNEGPCLTATWDDKGPGLGSKVAYLGLLAGTLSGEKEADRVLSAYAARDLRGQMAEKTAAVADFFRLMSLFATAMTKVGAEFGPGSAPL